MFGPGGHAGTCHRVAAAAKSSTPRIVQLHLAEWSGQMADRANIGGRAPGAMSGIFGRPPGLRKNPPAPGPGNRNPMRLSVYTQLPGCTTRDAPMELGKLPRAGPRSRIKQC